MTGRKGRFGACSLRFGRTGFPPVLPVLLHVDHFLERNGWRARPPALAENSCGCFLPDLTRFTTMQCGEARHIKLKVQHKAENRTPAKRELHPIEAYCNTHARQDKFACAGAPPNLAYPTFFASANIRCHSHDHPENAREYLQFPPGYRLARGQHAARHILPTAVYRMQHHRERRSSAS